jgi:hypothetical protein
VSECFTKITGWFGIQGLAPGDSNPSLRHNWRDYLELGGEPAAVEDSIHTPRVDGTANAIVVAALQNSSRGQGLEDRMKNMTLAATSVMALLFLLTLGAPNASADTFTFTSCHITGGCPSTNFGTVTLTQSGANVNVDVVLVNGNRFVETGAGANALFLFNATSGMTVSNMTATFNGGDVTSTLGGLTYAFTATRVHADGTGDFKGTISCTTAANCNGGSIVTTVNDLHFTIGNATLAQLEVGNPDGNFFVADIQCGATQTGCTAGLTGPVDVSESSVPDGGMTLMLLGGALVGVETLRRRFRA